MVFNKYLLRVLKVTISSSLALGLLACALILVIGETSMNFEIGLEIELLDGLWVLVGIPVITLLLVLIVSPISFFIHRLLFQKGAKSTSMDS